MHAVACYILPAKPVPPPGRTATSAAKPTILRPNAQTKPVVHAAVLTARVRKEVEAVMDARTAAAAPRGKDR